MLSKSQELITVLSRKELGEISDILGMDLTSYIEKDNIKNLIEQRLQNISEKEIDVLYDRYVDGVEYNKRLVKKYPFLYPKNAWTSKPMEGYDYTYNEIQSFIPTGWWLAWGEAYCEDLADFCNEKNFDMKDFYLQQVKEKYGGLRVYHSGLPNGWMDHEFAWEYISEHTCISCGKFPVKMRDDGWVSPWCDDCFKKQNPDASDLLLDRWTFDDELGGRLQEYLIINEFSKEGEREHLIDMKPYYKKIGWNYKPEDLISVEKVRALRQAQMTSAYDLDK